MSDRRGAIYARKSNEDSKNPGKSVADQVAEAQAEADRRGITVIPAHIFSDDGISASRHGRGKRRPSFELLLDGIVARSFDVIVMAELSRGTRDLLTLAAMLTACQEADVTIIISGREYDPSIPSDFLTLGVTGVMDATSSEQTSERVRRGVRGSAERGRPHGRNVLGYERIYKVVNGVRVLDRVEVVPEEAAIVRRCVEQVLAGVSAYQICRDFTRDNVPTPGAWVNARLGRPAGNARWSQVMVNRLVTSPTYVGHRTLNGAKVTDGLWPAIVTEAEHERLLAIVSTPARRRHIRERHGAVKHLLSGIAVCGLCGAPMKRLSGWESEKGSGSAAYLCSEKMHCSRKAEPVDELVSEVVLGLVTRPGFVAAMAQAEDDGGEAASILASIESARSRQSEVRRLVVEGQMPPADGAVMLSEITGLIDDMEKRLRSVVMPHSVVDLVPDDIADRWGNGMSISQKREIVKAFVTVEILPGLRGSHRFDPSTVRITPKGAA